MKKIILSAALFLIFTAVHPQTAVQQLLNNPALKHASVGISVVDLQSGRVVAAHDAQKSLTPASVLKLVTSATALEVFGGNFRYKTDVAIDADDSTRILVVGAGDPTLGSDAFGDNKNAFFIVCADALKRSLAADREYSVYVVDNLFGYDGVSPEWTWIDLGNYYAAGAYGISIFDNTYRLFFNTANRDACPQILRTEPEIASLTFENALTLNTTGSDNGYIYGIPFSNRRAVRGNIPAGRAEFSIKGDIPDPGLLLGETLAGYLRRTGFAVKKVETAREDYVLRQCLADRRQPYAVGETIFSYQSRPMKEIIREVNVTSNNHYAEHLIRSVGRYNNRDIYTDPLEQGIDYVSRFWKGKNIVPDALTMKDGCGLAPQNAVSAAFLTDLLVYMHNRSENSAVFFDSLPKTGQEGTLRSFLRGTKYAGKIRAKSGSIGGVQCYSGYLIDGNKKYAFTIMVNKFNGTRAQVRSAIEQFLLGL